MSSPIPLPKLSRCIVREGAISEALPWLFFSWTSVCHMAIYTHTISNYLPLTSLYIICIYTCYAVHLYSKLANKSAAFIAWPEIHVCGRAFDFMESIPWQNVTWKLRTTTLTPGHPDTRTPAHLCAWAEAVNRFVIIIGDTRQSDHKSHTCNTLLPQQQQMISHTRAYGAQKSKCWQTA